MTIDQGLGKIIYEDILSEFPDELRFSHSDSRNEKFEYIPMGCPVILFDLGPEYVKIQVHKVNSSGGEPTWYINTKEVYDKLKDSIFQEIRLQLIRLKATVRCTKGNLMLLAYYHHFNGDTIRVYDKESKSGHGFAIVRCKGELTVSLNTFPIRYLLEFEQEIKEILSTQSYKFSDF